MDGSVYRSSVRLVEETSQPMQQREKQATAVQSTSQLVNCFVPSIILHAKIVL